MGNDFEDDVGLDEVTEIRTDLKCPEPDCGAPMELRQSKYGLFYGCTRFPACRGTHGAHPDGRPLGTPADKATRQARMDAHRVFDRLWKERGWHRADAYVWLAQVMDMSEEKAHIGNFNAEQCRKVIRLASKEVSTSAWDRLMAED